MQPKATARVIAAPADEFDSLSLGERIALALGSVAAFTTLAVVLAMLFLLSVQPSPGAWAYQVQEALR